MSISTLLKSEIPQYSLTLPITGKKVNYRPYLVKEEKILLLAMEQKREHDILIGIKNLIEACCDDLDAGNIPIVDLEYVFLNLRAKSVGEIVEPVIVCPITGKNVNLKFDITEVRPTEINENLKINITDTIGVTLKYPTLNTLMKSEKKENSTEMEELFDLILLCIDEIWTEDEIHKASDISKEELTEFIDSMKVDQFNDILEFFKNLPKLRKEVTYKVPYEEGVSNLEPTENTVLMEGLMDFFG